MVVDDPTYVLDCIDDYQGKLLIIEHCLEHNIPFITSMGAAAKIDPTRIYIGDISDARGICRFSLFSIHSRRRSGWETSFPSQETRLLPRPTLSEQACCLYSLHLQHGKTCCRDAQPWRESGNKSIKKVDFGRWNRNMMFIRILERRLKSILLTWELVLFLWWVWRSLFLLISRLYSCHFRSVSLCSCSCQNQWKTLFV